MSSTEIYAVTKNSCRQIGTVRNAFRGAMYVWQDMARRYHGLESFPLFSEEDQMRVWNTQNHFDLPDHEKIILLSTMDRVVVKPGDKERLCAAFELYTKDHPNSSIGEQAEIIRAAELNGDEFISWCQTSVCEFQFLPKYDEDSDTYKYNDLSAAWDLFERHDEKE